MKRITSPAKQTMDVIIPAKYNRAKNTIVPESPCCMDEKTNRRKAITVTANAVNPIFLFIINYLFLLFGVMPLTVTKGNEISPRFYFFDIFSDFSFSGENILESTCCSRSRKCGGIGWAA